MYFFFLAIGMPKRRASKLYWNLWLPLLATIIFVSAVQNGYIHG